MDAAPFVVHDGAFRHALDAVDHVAMARFCMFSARDPELSKAARATYRERARFHVRAARIAWQRARRFLNAHHTVTRGNAHVR